MDRALLYGSFDAVDQRVEGFVDGHVLDEVPTPSELALSTLLHVTTTMVVVSYLSSSSAYAERSMAST